MPKQYRSLAAIVEGFAELDVIIEGIKQQISEYFVSDQFVNDMVRQDEVKSNQATVDQILGTINRIVSSGKSQ